MSKAAQETSTAHGAMPEAPDTQINAREVFGVDIDMTVPAFSERSEYVPDFDDDYLFDKQTTMALLAGFAHNRRVMVQGYHGTGKSTHIEQIAARLNWPCVRINLDSHVSRIDLVGKDAIVLKDGKQITEFQEGILPWAIQNPVALVFDEYDAGRPDVMFVIQRVLEVAGKLTLLDQKTKSFARTHISACLPPPIPSASAIQADFITARNKSIRGKWTVGILSPRSIIWRMTKKPTLSTPKPPVMKGRTGARKSLLWCGLPTSHARPLSMAIFPP